MNIRRRLQACAMVLLLCAAVASLAGEADKGAAGASDEAERQKRAAMLGLNKIRDPNEKPVPCPKCRGSGYAITLPCLNCNKSQKPGYKFTGQEYLLCNRCNGTQIANRYTCWVCQGKKHVLLSEITPTDGGRKDPPSGYLWCTVCNGTGVEIFSDCAQCKRSKYPGFLFHGESLSLCNRCGGKSKVPTLTCTNCQGKGIKTAPPGASPPKNLMVPQEKKEKEKDKVKDKSKDTDKAE